MSVIILVIAIFIGASLGSFIHLIISRFDPNLTRIQYLYRISCQRSYCPICKIKLTFFSLIPIVSWFIQKGKCRYCDHHIPFHYLLIELISALFCLIMIDNFGLCSKTILLIILAFYFCVLSLIDFHHFILPDIFIYPLWIAGLFCSYFKIGTIEFQDAIIGSILGFILLYLPAISYFYLRKKQGIGGGDIMLITALGSWIHFTHIPLLLLIASILGIGYIFIFKFQKIPFGPFLLISTYALLIFYYCT